MQRIVYDTFTSLKPESILLLTEAPEIIAERRQSRDNLQVSVESIKEFQDSEEAYAKEVAEAIGAKLFISKGSSDLKKAIEFIKSC